MTGAIRSSLLRAYRDTHYRAGGATVRIGRRCATMDAVLGAWGGRCCGFITAWNPCSRRLPVGINLRRQRMLAGSLRRLRSAPAEGRLRGWHEATLLVAADARVLSVVARRFGQNAIVVVRRGQPARLVFASPTRR